MRAQQSLGIWQKKKMQSYICLIFSPEISVIIHEKGKN